MSDCVIDAALIHLSNGDLAGRRPGNVLDRRLKVIEDVGEGKRRPRYNQKLFGEYQCLTKKLRNDVVAAFIQVLTDSGVRVKRNCLKSRDHGKATKCGWPSHDQHLLAAALEGQNPTIFVSEWKHGTCAASVLRVFGVRVSRIA